MVLYQQIKLDQENTKQNSNKRVRKVCKTPTKQLGKKKWSHSGCKEVYKTDPTRLDWWFCMLRDEKCSAIIDIISKVCPISALTEMKYR